MNENQKLYQTIFKALNTENKNGIQQWVVQWTVSEIEDVFGWLAEKFEPEDELVVTIEKNKEWEEGKFLGYEYIFELSNPTPDDFGERHTIIREAIKIDPDVNSTWKEFAETIKTDDEENPNSGSDPAARGDIGNGGIEDEL